MLKFEVLTVVILQTSSSINVRLVGYLQIERLLTVEFSRSVLEQTATYFPPFPGVVSLLTEREH